MIAIMFNLYLPKCSQREFQLQSTGSHTIKESSVLLTQLMKLSIIFKSLIMCMVVLLRSGHILRDRLRDRSHQDDFILATFH